MMFTLTHGDVLQVPPSTPQKKTPCILYNLQGKLKEGIQSTVLK